MENLKEKIIKELWDKFKSVLGNSSIDNKTKSMYDLEDFLNKSMERVEKEAVKGLTNQH